MFIIKGEDVQTILVQQSSPVPELKILVSLDVRLLPDKYRPYLLQPLRRVTITSDLSEIEALKRRLAESEQREKRERERCENFRVQAQHATSNSERLLNLLRSEQQKVADGQRQLQAAKASLAAARIDVQRSNAACTEAKSQLSQERGNYRRMLDDRQIEVEELGEELAMEKAQHDSAKRAWVIKEMLHQADIEGEKAKVRKMADLLASTPSADTREGFGTSAFGPKYSVARMPLTPLRSNTNNAGWRTYWSGTTAYEESPVQRKAVSKASRQGKSQRMESGALAKSEEFQASEDPYKHLLITNNTYPDDPVATEVKGCRSGGKHNWNRRGSNGYQRQYKCKGCGHYVQEWKFEGKYWSQEKFELKGIPKPVEEEKRLWC